MMCGGDVARLLHSLRITSTGDRKRVAQATSVLSSSVSWRRCGYAVTASGIAKTRPQKHSNQPPRSPKRSRLQMFSTDHAEVRARSDTSGSDTSFSFRHELSAAALIPRSALLRQPIQRPTMPTIPSTHIIFVTTNTRKKLVTTPPQSAYRNKASLLPASTCKSTAASGGGIQNLLRIRRLREEPVQASRQERSETGMRGPKGYLMPPRGSLDGTGTVLIAGMRDTIVLQTVFHERPSHGRTSPETRARAYSIP